MTLLKLQLKTWKNIDALIIVVQACGPQPTDDQINAIATVRKSLIETVQQLRDAAIICGHGKGIRGVKNPTKRKSS